jgi:poly(A) polymerase
LDNFNFLKEKMEELRTEELKPKPLLTGDDLLAMGMKPGPAIKPILEDAYELQLEKKLQTKEEARQWASERVRGEP